MYVYFEKKEDKTNKTKQNKSSNRIEKRVQFGNSSLQPSNIYFYCPFQGGTSLVEHLRYLCLVFVMLSRLFIAALWSAAGKGLTSWLLFVILICVFVTF